MWVVEAGALSLLQPLQAQAAYVRTVTLKGLRDNMTLKLDASAQANLQKAVEDMNQVTKESKGVPLTKSQYDRLLDDYTKVSGILSKDPVGSASVAGSEAELSTTIADAMLQNVTGNDVQSELNSFIADVNRNGGNLNISSAGGSDTSSSTPAAVTSGIATNGLSDKRADLSGDSTTVAGLQAQIVALESKLATATPDECKLVATK